MLVVLLEVVVETWSLVKSSFPLMPLANKMQTITSALIIGAGFGLSDQYDDVRLIVEGIVNLRSVIINRIQSFHNSEGVSCRNLLIQ